jgi:hypothetical protein
VCNLVPAMNVVLTDVVLHITSPVLQRVWLVQSQHIRVIVIVSFMRTMKLECVLNKNWKNLW